MPIFLEAIWGRLEFLGRLSDASWEGSGEPFGRLRGAPGTAQEPPGRHMGPQAKMRTILTNFYKFLRSVLELKNGMLNIKNTEK